MALLLSLAATLSFGNVATVHAWLLPAEILDSALPYAFSASRLIDSDDSNSGPNSHSFHAMTIITCTLTAEQVTLNAFEILSNED